MDDARSLAQFDADKDVKILSGVDEGAFAWLTLNYLLGRLGGSEGETVAAIDLGGGSVQVGLRHGGARRGHVRLNVSGGLGACRKRSR